MEKKIKMMAAASEALHYLRAHQKVTDEELLQYVTDYIVSENIKEYDVKFGMIAAATHTYKTFMKNPRLTDKEILRLVMETIPEILANMGNE